MKIVYVKYFLVFIKLEISKILKIKKMENIKKNYF